MQWKTEIDCRDGFVWSEGYVQQQRGWMVLESHQWHRDDVRRAVREVSEVERQQDNSEGIKQRQEINR